MPYHYKSDGSLDMRYSSSKAAVSSGGGNSSYSGFSSSNSGYGSSGSSSSALHYKKDGSLDMRYSTSKAAGDSSGYYGNSSGTSATSSPATGDVHYKKDGTPDMRYASSKAAAVSSGYYGDVNNNNSTSSSAVAGDLHLKKDGTPDMRYTTSKAAFGSEYGSTGTSLHHKKDGSLDMRFKSSRDVESRLNSAMAKVAITPPGIPSHIPLTKSGLPDMRSKAAKEWVMQQSSSNSSIPTWLPRKKDGSLDTSKAVALPFLAKVGAQTTFDHNCREQYYTNRLMDDQFKYHVDLFRKQKDTNEKIHIPKPCVLTNTQELKSCMIDSTALDSDIPLDRMISSQVRDKVLEIDYDIIRPTFGDEEKAKLGSGAFGVVLKGTWKGKSVAVKRLHLSNLNKREKVAFVKEIKILTLVGQHPNLVTLFGYCVSQPCLVMEFVELGSLAYLLHYCSDPKIEACVTDGRIKKKLICGVANGMHQLHEVGVVHADLKPANVLVDGFYTAKITDFGLATFRGKTTRTVVSVALEEDGENIVAGTGAYMAPELLDSAQAPEFKTDVYSFGILLNEVMQEEEPFSGQEANFHGRGPFGAVNYAKLGKRPFIKDKTPSGLKNLIENCWNASPSNRPTFMGIINLLETMEFPNSF